MLEAIIIDLFQIYKNVRLACKKSNFLVWFLLRKAYVPNFLLVTHILAIEQGKPRAHYSF